MARKITQDVVNAFMAGTIFNRENSSVEVRQFKGDGDICAILKLHGKVIAVRDTVTNSITVCDGNYRSNTTKERLNGIPGVDVQQKKGQWYLNGVEWDGSWQKV